MSPLRSRPEECLSDFAFDRRLAGESDETEVERLATHVATCDRCARRWNELRAERDAFARDAPGWKLDASARASSRSLRLGKGGRWLASVAGGLALAAVALLWARDDATRTKGGGFVFGLYVSHDGAVRAGAADERVVPGDALRFVYSLHEPRYFAVLSLDGAKRGSVYYPEGAHAVYVERGSRVALPASTVLDGVLGPETIYAVACAETFELEPLRRELEASGRVTLPASGCALETLALRKAAP